MIRGMDETMKRALDRAVVEAGGISALARAVEVSRQTIHNWINSGRVTTDYAIKVEGATGISKHDLRPDVFGARG